MRPSFRQGMALTHAETPAQHTARSWRRAIERASPALLIVALIVLWEVLTRAFEVPAFLLPAPSDIVRLMIAEWPLIQMHGLATLWSILSGYVVAALFALAVAA